MAKKTVQEKLMSAMLMYLCYGQYTNLFTTIRQVGWMVLINPLNWRFAPKYLKEYRATDNLPYTLKRVFTQKVVYPFIDARNKVLSILPVTFTTAYIRTREYMGPEEGGTWWDRQHPVKWSISLFTSVKRMEKKTDHLNHGDIYSVLGGEKVVIYTKEPYPGSNTREARPTYE